MAEVEVLLPKMGESVAEATITKWLKAEGDVIEAEESIVEIATDKVDSEIPAPADGILAKILVQEGEIAQVGQAICIITGEGANKVGQDDSPEVEQSTSNGTPASVNGAVEPMTVKASVPQPVAELAPTDAGPIAKTGASGRFYSPLVRNIAKQEGVLMEELETLTGTGKGGRVTKKDILAYIPNRNGATAPLGQPIAPSASETHAFTKTLR